MAQTSSHQDTNWVNQDNTATDSTNINGTYHGIPIYYKPHGETGWVCPRCGRGVAPWKSYCDCNDNWTITCKTNVGTGTPPPDWSQVTCKTEPGVVTHTSSGAYIYSGPTSEVHI